MSKVAKKRNSERRKAEKRKRKEANRTRYAGLVGTSQNKKKKGKNNKSGGKIPGHPHLSFCGNIGCKRCFPQYN